MTSTAPQLRDYITRTKGPSPLGTATFVLVRLLGPLVSYAILTQGYGLDLLNAIGFSKNTSSSISSTLVGFSYPQLAIFLMTVATTIKHVNWILTVSEQQMPVGSALFFGFLETIQDSLNNLLFMSTYTPPSAADPIMSSSGLGSRRFMLGLPLCVLGLFLESASEIQRRNFKRDPQNRGKPYSGGLFSLARNINYGGHTLWKTGFAMISAGWVWATVVGGTYFYDFASRAVPVLDQYCQQRVSFIDECSLPWGLRVGLLTDRYTVWNGVD